MSSTSVWNAKLIIFIIVAFLLLILFYLLFNYDELRSRGHSCNGHDHCLPGLFCSFQAHDDFGKCAYNIDEGVTSIGYPCYSLNECPSTGYCSNIGYCLPGQGKKQGQICQYNSDCLLGNYCDCNGHCRPVNEDNYNGFITENFSSYLIVPSSNLFINYHQNKVILEEGSTNPHVQTSYDGQQKIFTVTNVQGQVSYWNIIDDNLCLSDTNSSSIFLEIHSYHDHHRQFCLKAIDGKIAYYNDHYQIKFLAELQSGHQVLFLQETPLYS